MPAHDRPPWRLRRRRHRSRRANRDGRCRPRQDGRALDRRWLRGQTRGSQAPTTRRPSSISTRGTTQTRRARCNHAGARPPAVDVRGGRRGLGEATALFEARRCMSCGNCFQCDNCLAVCPDNAVLKLDDAKQGLRDRLRLLQGLRHLRRGMPVRRNRDGPGGGLGEHRHPVVAFSFVAKHR